MEDIEQFKSFKIHRHTARKLIKAIKVAQNEGFGFATGVQNLLDELEVWVKE